MPVTSLSLKQILFTGFCFCFFGVNNVNATYVVEIFAHFRGGFCSSISQSPHRINDCFLCIWLHLTTKRCGILKWRCVSVWILRQCISSIIHTRCASELINLDAKNDMDVMQLTLTDNAKYRGGIISWLHGFHYFVWSIRTCRLPTMTRQTADRNQNELYSLGFFFGLLKTPFLDK